MSSRPLRCTSPKHRRKSAAGHSAPLKPGDEVYVLGYGPPPFIEAKGTIIGPAFGIDDLFFVRLDEGVAQVRFVFPDWSRRPTETLQRLHALYRAAVQFEITAPFLPARLPYSSGSRASAPQRRPSQKRREK